MSKQKIKIMCTRSYQNGKELYNLSLTPEQLDLLLVIDYMESKDSVGGGDYHQIINDGDGYQRKRDKKDIKAVANHIMSLGSFLPNGVWLNDRDKTSYFEQKGKEENGIAFGYLCFHVKNGKLYCPDGQTRAKGVITAWLELNSGVEKEDSLNHFALPVVITRVSKSEERKGFLLINDNAKKVETIHKAAIRWQDLRALGNAGDLSKKEREQGIAYGIIERINSSGGSLDDMILFSKKEKYLKRDIKSDFSKQNKRKIKAGSFLNSLIGTGLITFMVDFHKEEDSEIQVINISRELNKFWNVIYGYTKPMWENSEQYAFLSAIGTRAVNTLFLYLMRLILDKKEEITKDLFKKYLSKSNFLQSHKKWIVTKGIKAHNISQSEIKNTMADKRGTSYGTLVAKDIFREICEKNGVNASKYINFKKGLSAIQYPPLESGGIKKYEAQNERDVLCQIHSS